MDSVTGEHAFAGISKRQYLSHLDEGMR